MRPFFSNDLRACFPGVHHSRFNGWHFGAGRLKEDARVDLNPIPLIPPVKRIFDRIRCARELARVRPPVQPVGRVAISMRPIFASWGGGNQWLLQMTRHLGYSGYSVRFDLREEVDAIFINHSGLNDDMTFGVDEIAAFKRRYPRVRVIHRVNDNDIRKETDRMDALLARFNAVADYTVFISDWLRDYHAARWFDPARPHCTILNGADPSVFHPVGSLDWPGTGAPLRLVTHHWSANPKKGFPQYAELDARIAGGELPGVELWVIGRWPSDLKWKAARTFPPDHGAGLAGLLRQCHGYITASLHEPGGMHFIEGLQCGLPLLYHLDGGGIVELGEKFGVGFRDDLLGGVRQWKEAYAGLRQRVLNDPPSGARMCTDYREVLQREIVNARK
jgi:glycosyltransferase involved in cell wall biosynthesis